MRSIPAVIAIAVLIGGCGQDVRSDESAAAPKPKGPQPSYAVVLTESDAGREVRVRRGQSLGIRLAENASIGNVWSVTEVPPILRDDGFRYQGEPSDRVGEGSTKMFGFTATALGRGALRMLLAYRDDPQREIVFPIIVE